MVHVTYEQPMQTAHQPILGFDATGIAPELLSALQKAGLTTPTPIQGRAIPVALEGTDLIGIAQTGTGKTLAFALPILDKLLHNEIKRALVILPTRELALQVEQSIRKISQYLPHAPRTISLIGGMPIYRQIRELKSNPQILLTTPGRLRDHLDQKTLNLSEVGMLVLDEADRMLDMGFAPQIKYVCSTLPAGHQTMLFSATMAPEIASLAAAYLHNPVRIEVATAGSNNAQIKQELVYTTQDNKTNLLNELLNEHAGTVLVFSRTKHGATKLAKKVQDLGHTAAEIHSNRSLGQRRQALDGFKSGKYRVLVATDVASRGIDVPDISVVINYDLPDAAEDYVHRIGRTGRASSHGLAISFATHDQVRDIKAIERLVKNAIPLSAKSAPQPVLATSSYGRGESRPYSGGPSSSFRPRQQGSFNRFKPRASVFGKEGRSR
jgi:ATP-dependent RNA helicase RhlE